MRDHCELVKRSWSPYEVFHKKKKPGPTIKKPSELDMRVKQVKGVSSSMDLINQKKDLPGPGAYEVLASQVP